MLTSARKSRSAEPGGIDGKPGKLTARAVVVIETETEEAVLPFSVTCAGVMLQTESVGAPLQDSETCWLNPRSGLTASLKFAGWPAFSVTEPEDTETEKSIPVPKRLTDCTFRDALSITERDPVRPPPRAGLK